VRRTPFRSPHQADRGGLIFGSSSPKPDPVSNLCGIVSVPTFRNSKDQTVILRVGDHPFIRHESTIFYGDAMIVECSAA
jgi:hypothetical protein